MMRKQHKSTSLMKLNAETVRQEEQLQDLLPNYQPPTTADQQSFANVLLNNSRENSLPPINVSYEASRSQGASKVLPKRGASVQNQRQRPGVKSKKFMEPLFPNKYN